jgi:hypothetical protein
MTDSLNRIPIGPTNGNAVYFVSVTRDIGGVPTQIFVPTTYDADMPTYVATIPASALAANKNHASIVNLTGSGKTVRIQHIYATPAMAAAIVGLQITLEVHGIAGTTPTGGNVITIRKHDTDDDDLPAQIEARANPTASPLANWILASGVVNPEETSPSRDGQASIFQKHGSISSLILRENQGLLIRQTALAGAGAINLHIVFLVD